MCVRYAMAASDRMQYDYKQTKMNDLAILAEYQKIEGDGCCRKIR